MPHSYVPFFNTCFYQGLIYRRVAPLVDWEPVSAGIMLPLLVKLGEEKAGDKSSVVLADDEERG